MCVVGYGAPGRADWAGVVRRRREGGAYEVGTIVVVYLDNEKRLGQDRVRLGDFPGKRIVEIIPSQDTRGIVGSVDPRKMQARKLIDLGYCDACAVLESSRKEDSK
ncbi:MAG: hypothetical protein ACI4UY_11270 [Kiritimatiellia bacterium]